MAKISTYLLVMLGVTLLFYFAGLTKECIGADGVAGTDDDDFLCKDNGPSSTLLSLALNPALNDASGGGTLYSWVSLGIVAATIAGAIIVGFAQSNPELAARGAIASFLLLLGFDFYGVFDIVKEANVYIAVLLFLPLMAVYIIAVVDWMGKF